MLSVSSTARLGAARRSPLLGDRRLAASASVALAALAAAAAAAVFEAPSATPTLLFALAMPIFPVVAWWAFARAPAELRRFWGFLAGGVTLWLLGSLVWYGYFATNGLRDPQAPGPWDLFFLVAYVLIVVGVYHGISEALPLRRALLDVSVAVAAGVALGAAVVGHELEAGVSAQALATVVRPLFGVVVVTLIASAALGAWHGLPLSVVLVGAGQVFYTVGSLVYGLGVEPGHVAEQWADLAWLSGIVVSVFAAVAVILRIDRPVRVASAPRIPDHPAGAGTVLLAVLAALAVAVGVVVYGYAAGNRLAWAVGLAATAWIGTAMSLRARGSIREVESAYADLDRALMALEAARDELSEANQELGRANAEVRAVHGAFEDLLLLADERTHGAMSDLIEETGADLAAMLESYRAPGRDSAA